MLSVYFKVTVGSVDGQSYSFLGDEELPSLDLEEQAIASVKSVNRIVANGKTYAIPQARITKLETEGIKIDDVVRHFMEYEKSKALTNASENSAEGTPLTITPTEPFLFMTIKFARNGSKEGKSGYTGPVIQVTEDNKHQFPETCCVGEYAPHCPSGNPCGQYFKIEADNKVVRSHSKWEYARPLMTEGGMLNYENEKEYYGGVNSDLQPEGEGEFIFPNKYSIRGIFKNGELDIEKDATVMWDGKRTYEGKCDKDFHPTGPGKVTVGFLRPEDIWLKELKLKRIDIAKASSEMKPGGRYFCSTRTETTSEKFTPDGKAICGSKTIVESFLGSVLMWRREGIAGSDGLLQGKGTEIKDGVKMQSIFKDGNISEEQKEAAEFVDFLIDQMSDLVEKPGDKKRREMSRQYDNYIMGVDEFSNLRNQIRNRLEKVMKKGDHASASDPSIREKEMAVFAKQLEELMREEEEEAKTKKPKKGKAKVTAPVCASAATLSSSSSSAAAASSLPQVNIFTPFDVGNAPKYKFINHVTRWRGAALEQIRRFTSLTEKGYEETYAHLTDDQCLKQRYYHDLPNLQFIFLPRNNGIFYFKNERGGYSLLAEMTYKDHEGVMQTDRGLIHVGLDSSEDPNIIYHMKFTPSKKSDNLAAFFKPDTQILPMRDTQSTTTSSQEDTWLENTPYDFDREKGVVCFNYSEDRKLVILPLNKK